MTRRMFRGGLIYELDLVETTAISWRGFLQRTEGPNKLFLLLEYKTVERATTESCRIAIRYRFQETNRYCLDTQET